MKPYGNEHKWVIDWLNSTKTGCKPGNNKRIGRRLYKKTRRAQDKAALLRETKGV
jgi:hypothetical protein